MDTAAPEEVRKLDAGKKREWKLQKTVQELRTWTQYLQTSAEAFTDDLSRFNSSSPSTLKDEKKWTAVMEDLKELKQRSSSLKAKLRRMR